MTMEIIELVAIIGTISGSIVGVMKFEIKRLCKDIDGISENQKDMKKELKEIHTKVFHNK
jgi:hypothetical protein